MLLNLICGECIKESMNKGTLFVDELKVPVTQISESGIYDVTCDKGHKTKVALRNSKFELLFDLGLNGLIDEYYREAVLNFTASLERFYEFFISVALYNEITNDMFKEVWKTVKAQSERQLGAYIFLYLKCIRKKPLLLDNDAVSFRNDVVHKGYIPNKEQTLEYGEKVRRIVNNAISEMKTCFGDALCRVYDHYLPKVEGEEDSFSCNITTILDVCDGPEFEKGDVRNRSLVDIIPSVINRRSPQRMRFFKEKPA
jgi:hypothetical protein